MPRLLFEKTGNAIWISHLDLMCVFQRAFKRAGLPLKHTQGFNPRPSVSIALPLSVGVESRCELLDFELDGAAASFEEITDKLNCVLVDGIRVMSTGEAVRKIRDISYLSCQVVLEYDFDIPEEAVEKIGDLFSREQLIVPKKTKNGIQDQDIIPMIRRIDIQKDTDNTICIEAMICCQNPSLNPMQLVSAIGLYLPDHKPNFSKCLRKEIFDKNEEVFR